MTMISRISRAVAAATAIVFSLRATAATAAACTDAQLVSIRESYRIAAVYVGCTRYANFINAEYRIYWDCDSYECTNTIMEMAAKLPYCEDGEGVNRRKELEYLLHDKCGLCTLDQQNVTQALWQAAATTSSCAPYADSRGATAVFSWPCSATGCAAVLQDVADKAPDCKTRGVNEKARIRDSVAACAANATSPSVNNTGSTCTQAQVAVAQSLWETAAASDACKPYAILLTSYVSVSSVCGVADCTAVLQQLAEELPECVYEGQAQSEKRSVKDELEICSQGLVPAPSPSVAGPLARSISAVVASVVTLLLW